MTITESIRIALGALLSNKLRAILTMLGIIIGVAAVITLMSVGKGVELLVQESFESIGTNLLYVFPGSLQGSTSSQQPELSMGDYQAIADPFLVPDALSVAPELSSRADVVAGRRDIRTEVAGVTPDYAPVRNKTVSLGDFITDGDVNARSRVAVLGSGASENLFEEGTYPIGQTIKINRIAFRVVGVLEEQGGAAFGTEDNVIYVPLTTAQTRLYPWYRSRSGDALLSALYVQVAGESLMDQTAQDITNVLRQRHDITFRDEDDFTIINQTDLVSIFGDITGVLTIFLGAIAAISLLVGGIGIMNIMLVSVTERTREIGIRKAVGAKRRDILLQFLVEAVTLSLVGGLVGVGLGLVGSRFVGSLAENLTTVITPDVVLLSTGVSAAVGLLFGIYPAFRAARLNPIDALRYE
ncbi:MAG: ABC transporter permease [Anaerolineae bacterium]|nr:ABC transporter permease [Anaerolineae bacterium]MDX9829937.1 ABC transporter permease [Anaerolineae bacterium]